MSFTTRRIVTGHNEAGKSCVAIDRAVPSTPGRFDERVGRYDPWASEGAPPVLDGPDANERPGTVEPHPGGTIFRILEIPPGNDEEFHKTDTIDYYVILEGEIYLLLDEKEVLCRAGDVIVQRSTSHGWGNRSGKPAVFAEVLISVKGR